LVGDALLNPGAGGRASASRVRHPEPELMGGRTITEPAREIDVMHQTGVLVVGSGPSGLSAALAAARGL
jgi:hypothetical protein